MTIRSKITVSTLTMGLSLAALGGGLGACASSQKPAAEATAAAPAKAAEHKCGGDKEKGAEASCSGQKQADKGGEKSCGEGSCG